MKEKLYKYTRGLLRIMINLVTNNNFKSLSKEAIALYKRIRELRKKEVANAMKSIYQNELSQGYNIITAL